MRPISVLPCSKRNDKWLWCAHLCACVHVYVPDCVQVHTENVCCSMLTLWIGTTRVKYYSSSNILDCLRFSPCFSIIISPQVHFHPVDLTTANALGAPFHSALMPQQWHPPTDCWFFVSSKTRGLATIQCQPFSRTFGAVAAGNFFQSCCLY